MLDFLKENWGNLGLIIVGASAFVAYILTESRKRIEAASLIINQIDEIQETIREMSTFIINSTLNETAFYEMLAIIDENYWDKYRHYFINKIDKTSYSNINNLFKYATALQEQQTLLKNLQKNFFFETQRSIIQLETQSLSYNLSSFDTNQFPIVNNNYHEFNKAKITDAINKKGLTNYIPVQIGISLEKIIKECSLLEITGCSGYNKLKKIANKRF